MTNKILLIAFLMLPCVTQAQERRFLESTYASCTITIDGLDYEPCWEETEWMLIDQLWLGEQPSATDFSGKFKVLWDSDYLYLLANITDDVFHDEYADPLTNWWKDDCLEIFVDEDNSGGDHKHNYNAFAYHINMFHDAVDLGMDGDPHLFNNYLESEHTSDGNVYTWEVRIPLYTDAFSLTLMVNLTRTLAQGDTIGLSVAYCDNDGGMDRESFIGSQQIEGPDKNTSYKNASVFGAVILTGSEVSKVNYLNDELNLNVTNHKIIFKSSHRIKQVIIFQLNGGIILQKQNPGNDINISTLEPGLYIMQVTNTKSKATYRFVKD